VFNPLSARAEEIERRAAESMKASAEKRAKKGEVLKSLVIIDVKPWEDTTGTTLTYCYKTYFLQDLVELEKLVRGITMEGLEWKACKLY
jgi:hypothetical protein